MKNQLDDIEVLSKLLDSKFKGPFGFRFGFDGIIGLIPGVGDFITSILSGYIVLRAVLLGYPVSVILRMLFNVLVDSFLQSIPVLGNIFDFFVKSNQRNFKLMKAYDASPVQTEKRSLYLTLALGAIVMLLILSMSLLMLFIAYKILVFIVGLV